MKKILWFLAVCNDDGVCVGYLTKDEQICESPDDNIDSLMCFNRKKDADEKALQINLSKALLPNGYPFRVAVVKG